jgi:hypothetical protein
MKGAQAATDGLLIAAVASFFLSLAELVFGMGIVTLPIVAAALGAGAVLGYIWGSSRSLDPYRVLLDADRAYRTHEQLSTAFELEERDGEAPFSRAIAARVAEFIADIDPRRLYRPTIHRRYLLLPALLLATAVVTGLENDGGSTGQTIVQLGGEQAPPTDQPPTLAPDNRPEGGVDLAQELRNLGSESGTGEEEPEPDEEAERLEAVEEQVRQLERQPLEDDDIEMGEEAEEAVRGALRSGMSESQIIDMITQMRDAGESTAEMVDEIEEATSDLPPNANLENEPSEEAVENLASQLVPVPTPEDAEAQPGRDGQQDAGRPTEGGEAELTEGTDSETGEAQGSSDAPPGQEQSSRPETEGEEQAPGESPSDRGGRMPEADSGNDDFSPTNESRVAAEITGKVVEETFLNLVIRDLPREAISELEDLDPDVRYERAVERAIDRDTVPRELEPLVRSYFLRIAQRAPQNEGDDE